MGRDGDGDFYVSLGVDFVDARVGYQTGEAQYHRFDELSGVGFEALARWVFSDRPGGSGVSLSAGVVFAP